jgi:hypothetical protein
MKTHLAYNLYIEKFTSNLPKYWLLLAFKKLKTSKKLAAWVGTKL